jgi:hypothetical protein
MPGGIEQQNGVQARMLEQLGHAVGGLAVESRGFALCPLARYVVEDPNVDHTLRAFDGLSIALPASSRTDNAHR